MRRYNHFILSFLLLLTSGCVTGEKNVLYSPPSLLPFTTPEMKTAGYWIGRHPFPDKNILSDEDISRLNRQIREELKLTQDIAQWPRVYPADALRNELSTQLKELKDKHLVMLDGKKLSSAFWDSAEESLNIAEIPNNITRRYGLVLHYADQKFLPTDEHLYSKAYDMDFDELQNSALDIGTPVVVLHQSLDNKWIYVQSSTSFGWVKAENIVITDDEEMKFAFSGSFIITTAPKADVYLDKTLTAFYGSTLMGTRLPLVQSNSQWTEVLIPSRKNDGTAWFVSGFIATDQINIGYLSYTPRNILRQAFKMIHQPYGWGGLYGEQDCSRFLQEIFATVGIELPRDSKNQIKSGYLLAEWDKDVSDEEKLNTLKNLGVGGITILGMKGHIILYLGTVDHHAYAIHSVWAYRQPRGAHDDTYVLNRVTISDLSLGEKSKRGSLLQRINTVRFMQ